LFWLILVWKKQAEVYPKTVLPILLCGLGFEEDNPYPVVMSSADTLFDGSIPRTKVAQVCVEALFEPSARNKIVEIVAKAGSRNFEQLFANVARRF